MIDRRRRPTTVRAGRGAIDPAVRNSMTGLLLTASYTWMKGYAYDFLAILHAATVIVTLLYLPFGKLFHIFQRPAQLGVSFWSLAIGCQPA